MKVRSVQSLSSHTLFDYYFAARSAAEEAINNYSHKQLIGIKTEELTDYLYQRHALASLEMDETRSAEWDMVAHCFTDNVTRESLFCRTFLSRFVFSGRSLKTIEQSLGRDCLGASHCHREYHGSPQHTHLGRLRIATNYA